ncbi:acyltransferase family protein [Pseudoroseomonas ludipueritiae]|uniref:Acyltransferase n=1 Tax=Pseudoroseomonas ludipueritiae TaxID=198093 RepID=A0ABR7R5F2_9PROT|nr:acyltransferase [Pseudoroseomonas ludipueritiae]MBC9176892.1 acyltransferase [Pseudoroseomonas ludipueritiae]
MNRSLSVYLDLVRFLAAMVVFLGHLAGKRFTGGLFWQANPLMDEAVTVFFVMSGFVISYVVYERRENRDSYFVARVARITSVAIPALLMTAVLDGIGRSLHPEYYNESWGFSDNQPVLQYAGALLFLNRIWYAQVDVGSNLPYWSLCYEVWYYFVFGMFFFGRGKARLLGCAAAAAICGPAILSLMPIWLCGLVAHRCCRRAFIGQGAGLALSLFTATALVAYLSVAKQFDAVLPQLSSFFGRENIVHDWIVGVLFAAHLVGISAASTGLARFILPLARPIRWLAGATFSIYLFHLPLAQFLTTVVPWPPEHALTRIVMLAGSLGLIFVAAEFTERRKGLWMPFARMLLNSLKSTRRLVSARQTATS